MRNPEIARVHDSSALFPQVIIIQTYCKSGGGCVNDIIIIIKYWVVPL